MPIVVTCPSCSQTLKAPDAAAGKKVKCPKCTSTIMVPVAAAPEEDIVEEFLDEPAPRGAVARPLEPRPAGAPGFLSRASLPPQQERRRLTWLGFGTLGLAFFTAFVFSLAMGFAGNALGIVIFLFAGLLTVFVLGLAVVTFLLALRHLFATRDWVGAAGAVGGLLAFIAGVAFTSVLFMGLSTWILGERVQSAVGRPSSSYMP